MDHVTVTCQACGGEAPGGGVCPACGRLQPFPPGWDHWSVLGVPRRLVLDRGELEHRFHELNRRFHPDYFRLRSPEEQAVSLENSAAVNGAYRALRDPVGRVEYLLEREGIALGTAGQARPPADLFEEILELQEARQELAGAGPAEASGLRKRLESARADLEARAAGADGELQALFPRWDMAGGPEQRELLGRMRDVLATRAYLRTVLRDLAGVLGDGQRVG
jgi:molecular chaperone HscB